MNKVIVIGCPGGGKSTFARALSALTGLPIHHLDQMYWNPDRTTIPKQVFRGRLTEVISGDKWIIDGNYGSTMELRLEACDTVFFLDYPTEVCLEGVRVRRGKPRPDMPWIESEDEEDAEFIRFIEEYNAVSRPKVLELLQKYSNRTVIVFHSREEADAFLEKL